uniref:Uncharacterized protein n=1 Tax=Anguilla anguilla TaxID=7936 RepID=A0A0E9RDT4_ANGAN
MPVFTNLKRTGLTGTISHTIKTILIIQKCIPFVVSYNRSDMNLL